MNNKQTAYTALTTFALARMFGIGFELSLLIMLGVVVFSVISVELAIMWLEDPANLDPESCGMYNELDKKGNEK